MLIFGKTLFAANENAENQDLLHCITAANEFQIEQEDSFFVPFGDYPLRRSGGVVVTQQFDEASGQLIIDQFTGGGLRGMFQRSRKPVYIGHPDTPGNETRWPDKKAYGWIIGAVSDVVDGQRGLRFMCKWSQDGKDLISNGHFLYYSPYWGMKASGYDGNGRQIFRPALLVSMGLVNDPNIPVPAMANENTNPKKEDPTMDPLKQLLMKLGVLLGVNEATEETILQQCRTNQTELVAANQAKTTAETALTAANEALASAETAQANAKTAQTEAEAKFANEHTTRIDDRLELAANAGQIIEADKDKWLTAFNENFDDAAKKISELKPLTSSSKTHGLGGKATQPSAQDAMLSAVNEVMATKQIPYAMAWNEVATTKPDLVEALNPKQ